MPTTITLSNNVDVNVTAAGTIDLDATGATNVDAGPATFNYTIEDEEGATSTSSVTVTAFQSGIYVDVDGDNVSAPTNDDGSPIDPYGHTERRRRSRNQGSNNLYCTEGDYTGSQCPNFAKT